LGQPKDAQQGGVIAAELIATRRHIVVGDVNHCVRDRGQLVLDCRYAIPAARVREAYEQRKQPQP
jgi:hypothetical protein